MKLKPITQTPQKHLFQVELIDIVSPRHELVKLAKLIDWQLPLCNIPHKITLNKKSAKRLKNNLHHGAYCTIIVFRG